MGINTAIRTVEEFLNEAKGALKTREPRRMTSRPPLDSKETALVRQEVRAAVNDALSSALEEAKARAPGEVAYYSVEKAAALAEVHPDTIRAWVKNGRLPEHRAGRGLRIRRDELHRFLDRASHSDVRPTAEDEAAMILARRRQG